MWSNNVSSSLVLTAAVLVSVGGIGQARAEVIDNFDTAHDYLADGVAGTVWNGLLNAGNASAVDANTSNAGQLTITTNGNTTAWDGGGQSGPMLYQEVTGDFVASVTISSGDANNFNVASLLARNPSTVTTAADESFYSVNYNFFGATPGVQRRNVNPGSTTKFDTTTVAVGAPTMLQIERTGDDFLASYSTDGGANWIAMGSAVTKSDMPDTIQIGLAAANYGNNSFSVVFDDFVLVPEPASLGLLALGALAMMPRPRR